jgi:CheY-like chemotaxis protein/HPt (histidine-containing phosphotransfer) domain-containing protein
MARELRMIRDVQQLKIIMLTSAGPIEKTVRNAGIDIQGVFTKPLHQSSLYECMVQTLAPPADRAQRRAGDAGGEIVKPRTPLRILLAEDNVVNQRVAQLMLEKLDQKADAVANGREAVRAAREVPYDVILMDVLMPEMDGLEAARAIRTQLPVDRQPRIIAMTASVLAGDRERCLQAGMNDYISKPVKFSELAQALARTAPLKPGAVRNGGSADPLIPLERRCQDATDRFVAVMGMEPTVSILSMMLSDMPRLLAELRNAMAKADAAGISLHAHSLKSNARMVGDIGLAEDLQEIEQLATGQSLAEAPPRMERAEQGLERLMKTVASLRQHYLASSMAVPEAAAR